MKTLNLIQNPTPEEATAFITRRCMFSTESASEESTPESSLCPAYPDMYILHENPALQESEELRKIRLAEFESYLAPRLRTHSSQCLLA